MSNALAELRSQIQKRFPDAIVDPKAIAAARSVATGIDALDRALQGGLPRGQLSVFAPGSGATALLRAACAAAKSRGEWSAWISPAGIILEAAQWDGIQVLRPEGEVEALECAEEILASGGLALVVLARVPATPVQRQRLLRAARSGNTALVLIDPSTTHARLRLRSAVAPEQYQWRHNAHDEPAVLDGLTLQVTVQDAGPERQLSIPLGITQPDARLSLSSGLADRRGTAG